MRLEVCWKVVGVVVGCAGVTGVMGAEGGDPLPGTPWRVHDMSRPVPPKVESGGAVSVRPPSDAEVLFDGGGLDAWNGDWEVKDGILIATKGNLDTKETWGEPFQLHVEWRVPAGREVSGQHGGNSGIFLMGLYEVQVLESHDNRSYADGQAGAMYGQYPPLVNAAAPQGEWQSYDILFSPPVYEGSEVKTPATLTLLHNGVAVQVAQPYMGPTRHMKLAKYPDEHPETGPIRLQFHGDPIEYRNLWIRTLGERDGGGVGKE